jgi:hypothetical protein
LSWLSPTTSTSTTMGRDHDAGRKVTLKERGRRRRHDGTMKTCTGARGMLDSDRL